jgi:hypothetical protein
MKYSIGKRDWRTPENRKIIKIGEINPSAWGFLNTSSYCDVGRFFYRPFQF